jgi:hypothetical protein
MAAAPEMKDRWTHVPAELRERQQWVVWRMARRPGDPKPTKVPYRAESPATKASHADRSTWSTFEAAVGAVAKVPGLNGIGYVFAPDDPYCGVDLDNCIGPDGEVSGWAARWLDDLGGYQEVSPSQNGVKVVVRACVPRGRKTGSLGGSHDGGCEVYCRSRFFTITGDVFDARPIEDRQSVIDRLIGEVFPPLVERKAKAGLPRILPLLPDDDTLLDRARRAKNGEKFQAIYDRGDWQSYYKSHSEADAGLCQMIAFWTGVDTDRIDRIFRRSALMRSKWDEPRGEYTVGDLAISHAVSYIDETYSPTIDRGIRSANGSPHDPEGEEGVELSSETVGRSGRNYKFPLIVRGSDVEPKEVRWLWRDRIPFGFLTLMAGRTGVGKSFTTLDVAARVTIGSEIPEGNGQNFEVGSILIISEDSHEYMLSPRLREAGANMSRVTFMSWEAMAEFTLADSQMLDDVYFDAGEPKLVVIDPPTNFLGNKDEHRNAEVRSVLMGVSIWSMKHDVATVMITHCNKGIKKDMAALDRVIGSIAWASTSRIAHIFSPHPDERGQAVFLPLKNNLGQMAEGIAYRIVKTLKFAKVEWLGRVEFDADDAMAGEKKKPRGVAAVEWLEERFREKREWRSDDLKRDAAEAGVSKNALWSPEVLALPIRKAKRTDATGESHWFWIAQDDWPPEKRNGRESGNLGNLETQTV